MTRRAFQLFLGVGAMIVVLGLARTSYLMDTSWRRDRMSRRIQELKLKCLRDPNNPAHAQQLVEIARSDYSFAATLATSALGQLGEQSRPHIPTLGRLVRSSDPFVAREAALALRELGPLSLPALDDLEFRVGEGYQGTDVSVFSIQAIGEIGKAAESSLPLLTEARELHPELSAEIDAAVKKITQEPNE